MAFSLSSSNHDTQPLSHFPLHQQLLLNTSNHDSHIISNPIDNSTSHKCLQIYSQQFHGNHDNMPLKNSNNNNNTISYLPHQINTLSQQLISTSDPSSRLPRTSKRMHDKIRQQLPSTPNNIDYGSKRTRLAIFPLKSTHHTINTPDNTDKGLNEDLENDNLLNNASNSFNMPFEDQMVALELPQYRDQRVFKQPPSFLNPAHHLGMNPKPNNSTLLHNSLSIPFDSHSAQHMNTSSSHIPIELPFNEHIDYHSQLTTLSIELPVPKSSLPSLPHPQAHGQLYQPLAILTTTNSPHSHIQQYTLPQHHQQNKLAHHFQNAPNAPSYAEHKPSAPKRKKMVRYSATCSYIESRRVSYTSDEDDQIENDPIAANTTNNINFDTIDEHVATISLLAKLDPKTTNNTNTRTCMDDINNIVTDNTDAKSNPRKLHQSRRFFPSLQLPSAVGTSTIVDDYSKNEMNDQNSNYIPTNSLHNSQPTQNISHYEDYADISTNITNKTHSHIFCNKDNYNDSYYATNQSFFGNLSLASIHNNNHIPTNHNIEFDNVHTNSDYHQSIDHYQQSDVIPNQDELDFHITTSTSINDNQNYVPIYYSSNSLDPVFSSSSMITPPLPPHNIPKSIITPAQKDYSTAEVFNTPIQHHNSLQNSNKLLPNDRHKLFTSSQSDSQSPSSSSASSCSFPLSRLNSKSSRFNQSLSSHSSSNSFSHLSSTTPLQIVYSQTSLQSQYTSSPFIHTTTLSSSLLQSPCLITTGPNLVNNLLPSAHNTGQSEPFLQLSYLHRVQHSKDENNTDVSHSNSMFQQIETKMKNIDISTDE